MQAGARLMAGILLIVGIVVAAAGLTTIGFGIPINEFTLGNTLILAGTTALTGGLLLIGLSAAITELGRVAEGLRTRIATRPAPRSAETSESASPPAPAIAPPAPAIAIAPAARPPTDGPMPSRSRPDALAREVARAPESYAAAPSAVEVSAAAIERLRSSIPRTERARSEPSEAAHIEAVPLSPSNASHSTAQHQAQQPRPAIVEPAPAENVTAEDRAGGAAVEALKASRLDFLFRSKAPRQAPQSESFETFWPADAQPEGGGPGQTDARARSDQTEKRPDGLGPDRRPEPPASDVPRTSAILKSGVVDGMAYTLYADGSIEAKLPHGTVRFGSIAELRAHIESNS
jgi:hypothetical protein